MIWELCLTKEDKEALFQAQKARMALRSFLHEQGFLEVDIPVVIPSKSFLYGGIPITGQVINGYLCPVMTPFIRRWLVLFKEIGVSRVYFIGKCFRDEKTDWNRYPIFENLALGVCGKDYRFLMELIQEMVSRLLLAIGKEDFTVWKIIPFSQLSLKTVFTDSEIDEEKALVEYSALTAELSEPTFVTELPTQLFGPAKKLSQGTKERAELFIDGIEIGNISTFLTDPEELSQWCYAKGIDFNQYLIEKEHLESVSTLKGGLVTTGAIGLSRLYMILVGLERIAQTVPFPYFGR